MSHNLTIATRPCGFRETHVTIVMLRTAELDYYLPEELIATQPVSPRDSAKLMVLRRSEPEFMEHVQVRDLPAMLRADDVMVVNQTRVLPARFQGVRDDTGGKAEGLFVREVLGEGGIAAEPRWQVLLKLRRAKPGVRIRLDLNARGSSGTSLRLIERAGAESGEDAAGWIVGVEGVPAGTTTPEVLDQVGWTPLPPYILAARRKHEQRTDDSFDRAVYQTVYASAEPIVSGSVAAPTAGLHFTPELLTAIDRAGVHRAEVELQVGMGTFKPVETEYVEQHAMHSEWCRVPAETAARLAAMRTRRGTKGDHSSRVLAVGTTTARTLESFDSTDDMLVAPARETRILITPGYRFRHIDALMTNFHLPRSTLLAMVAAFLDDDERVRGLGMQRLLAAYGEAIRRGYRFYSFGDAMVIWP